MKIRFYAGVAAAALCIPGAAFAQSTGSQDFDKDLITVTASTSSTGIVGVQLPKTSKAKGVLSQEFIANQTPGQSINDIINQLPGVSFQNNDPFGSAGGTLNIRGFDSSRISQTFDGVPLNDSGNYALYSNQQLDPELIEQVNVNFGSTDVDSPTAAATGSTVNYRTRLPGKEFGIKAVGSVGSYNFRRVFGMIDTGEVGPWGTRAFFSASTAKNDNVYNNFGKIDKQQYNFRVYQPIGSNGDFISVAGNYNQNRNNFFGSVALRTDRPTTTVVPNRFPVNADERFYTIAPCSINTVARAGVADAANSCGSTFDERFNPSNTGNIRVQSRFTLADKLVLTVDPSYQYVKANGGGTAVGREGFRDLDPSAGVSNQTGYQAGTPYFGRDLNGDGDILDTVRVLAPSQTQTTRFGVIASLRYEINDEHSVRIAYSWDHARHRQTGEVGLLQTNGAPFDVFPVNNGLADVGGNILQKRDRLSYAVLNQISGEYRGEFFDGKLTATVGIRAPFFKRDLTNYCSTSSASGFVECYGTNTAGAAAYSQFNPTVQGPQQRILKYSRVLPNIGFTYDVLQGANVYFNYSKGLQVPGTDNLYNSFFFAPGTPEATPVPETTDNFDLGFRYSANGIQAQFGGFYTRFSNRLASAYDPVLDVTVYRNLGVVNRYGIDGDISYRPIKEIALRVFGSYLKSEIQNNVQTGRGVDCTAATITTGGCALTAGKRESGSPTFTLGASIRGNVGIFSGGIQAKRTGPRYVNDENLPIFQTVSGVANTVVYGDKAPAYTLVDLDFRVSLKDVINDKTYFQLNVTNLFDKLYVGGFGGNLTRSNLPFVQIGAPRAVIGSLVVGF